MSYEAFNDTGTTTILQCCGTGTGTGTVTCEKFGTGTGTVINYGSGTGTRHKIMYLISFIKHFFHSHFTINLLKFMNFFLVKQLTE
jgi:hypothetical protein